MINWVLFLQITIWALLAWFIVGITIQQVQNGRPRR